MSVSLATFDEPQRVLSWLRRALLVLLGVLLLALAVQLLWRSLDTPQIAAASLDAVPAALGGNSDAALSVGRWSLFGRDVAPVAGALPEPSRETGLNLVLKGTYADPDTERGFAIIAAADGDQQLYRVDDEVPGGATLQRIQRDRVVLLHNGEPETLSLPELRDAAPASTASSSGPQVRGQLRDLPPPGGLIGGLGAPGTAPGSEWQIVRQQMMQDPSALAREVQVIPHVDPSTGQLAGIRLNPGRDSTLMQRAGLLSSDIITEVNGIRLDNLSKGRELVDSLSTADRVSVTLRRDGREQTLEISLRP